MSCSKRGHTSLAGLTRQAVARAVRLAIGIGGVMAATMALATPTDIDTDFADSQVLVELPETPPLAVRPGTSRGLADQVQTLLQQARSSGDPRYLGYAMTQLQDWPESAIDHRLMILRATLNQSLHQFDQARTDLLRVLEDTPSPANYRQATLTLANLELVQGRYPAANQACQQLKRQYHDLVAQNCLAQVQARTGQPAMAYQRLQVMLRSIPSQGPGIQAWTEGTLGEIAAQLGEEVALDHWHRALELDPNDLYTRTLATDWLIQHQRFDEALELTAGYADVDSLAVLRAIALTRLQHSREAEALIDSLKQRFEEALWRGNLLHRRDYARFLLDVTFEYLPALEQARLNWQEQREPLDTRLLLRTARAAGDTPTVGDVFTWLDRNGQTDARFGRPADEG